MRELATLVERDQSTYWRYEEGSTPIPLEIARRLAAFYDVSVEHLMGWDDDRERQKAKAA